jgi:hypothetical protein
VSFTDAEIRRYGRQMVLSEVGGLGQERLRAARVTATDELEALYLAGAGVGEVVVPNEEIGEAVRALNPHVRVTIGHGSGIGLGAEGALTKLKEILAA